MPQLQITAETMTRIKIITGISHVRDGDFMVNEFLDEKDENIIQLPSNGRHY